MQSVSATLGPGLSDQSVSHAGQPGTLSAVWDGDTEVPVGPLRGDPTSGCTLDQAALQQVGFVDILDGISGLAEGHGDRADTDGAALEFVYDEPEIIPIGPVETEMVDTLHVEGGVRRLLVYPTF